MVVLLEALPCTYIFIDGLDEAEGYALRQPPRGTIVDGKTKLNHDVEKTMGFLYAEAAKKHRKVRLWCSSQYTASTKAWMQSGGKEMVSLMQELPLTMRDTKEDLLGYLTSAIPRGISEEEERAVKALLTARIETNLKGSFLWAYLLRMEITSVEDPDDLLGLLQEERLPTEIDAYYEKHIQRIKAEEYHGNGRKKDPPTWK